MPNWCNNHVTLQHNDAAMIDRVVTGLEGNGLFGEFLPCPAELSGQQSPFKGTEAEGQRLTEAYGANNWYDWCVRNWGTKWDVNTEDFGYTRPNLTKIKFGFDTAWSPPIAFYEHLATLGFTIEAMYNESGMAFAGTVTNDGQEIFDDFYDYSDMDSDEAEKNLPEELNEFFCISETMAEYEDENED